MTSIPALIHDHLPIFSCLPLLPIFIAIPVFILRFKKISSLSQISAHSYPQIPWRIPEFPKKDIRLPISITSFQIFMIFRAILSRCLSFKQSDFFERFHGLIPSIIWLSMTYPPLLGIFLLKADFCYLESEYPANLCLSFRIAYFLSNPVFPSGFIDLVRLLFGCP